MNSLEAPRRNTAFDQPESFGWISIALHWTTAVLIIAMWIIGKNVSLADDGSSVSWRNLHVTIGLTGWILLAVRVVWRLVSKHPHAKGLATRTHLIAKTAHYVMLLSLTLIILSGPIMAWLGRGDPIGAAAFAVHKPAGDVLLILTITHVLAATKHVMFHDDDSVIRMLWPKGWRKNNDR